MLKNPPSIPDFAVSYDTCTAKNVMDTRRRHGPDPEATHCGGCGWVHAAVDVFVSDTPLPVDEFFNLPGAPRRGHVGGYYDRERGFLAVCISRCCRDSRVAATWHPAIHCQWKASTTYIGPEFITEEYERKYASAAGLGL